jgi:hypothetical protein
MSDRIAVLVKRIYETRPVQSSRRQALLDELRQLRRDFDVAGAPEQAPRLDAAILILEFMSRSEDVATAETIRIVGELVATLDENRVRTTTPPPPSAEAARPAPAPASAVAARPAPVPAIPEARPAPPRGNVSEDEDLSLTQACLLGSILLQARMITEESLSRALQLHTSSRLPLGQCLIQLGAVTPEQIAAAVQYQDRLREDMRVAREERTRAAATAVAAAAAAAATVERLELRMSQKQRGFVQSFHAQVLGEVLIRLGVITREQLERALKLQRASNLHIGEALVQSGATTWEHVKRALEVQRQLRRSA